MASSVPSIKASARKEVGKGSSRAVRREGNIPAVIYGAKEAPITISLEARSFAPLTRQAGFFNHLVDIEADGKKIRVLPRDVQFDPLSDQPVHVDFLRVSGNTRIRVYVPVVFIDQDKSPGLKRGGVLNVVQHQLQVICAPEKIPESIRVSVDGLEIGDAIHLESIKLGEDVKPVISNRDSTVASIAAPTTVQEEEVKPAVAEGEVPATEGAAAVPGAAPAAGAAPGAAPAAGAAPAKGAAPAAAKGAAPAAGEKKK